MIMLRHDNTSMWRGHSSWCAPERHQQKPLNHLILSWLPRHMEIITWSQLYDGAATGGEACGKAWLYSCDTETKQSHRQADRRSALSFSREVHMWHRISFEVPALLPVDIHSTTGSYCDLVLLSFMWHSVELCTSNATGLDGLYVDGKSHVTRGCLRSSARR